MNLYLDDDSAKAKLIALLRQAGHRVVIPADVAMSRATDARHFELATLVPVVKRTSCMIIEGFSKKSPRR